MYKTRKISLPTVFFSFFLLLFCYKSNHFIFHSSRFGFGVYPYDDGILNKFYRKPLIIIFPHFHKFTLFVQFEYIKLSNIFILYTLTTVFVKRFLKWMTFQLYNKTFQQNVCYTLLSLLFIQYTIYIVH